MKSRGLSEERRASIAGIVFGLVLAVFGAGVIWGFGGTLLVLGTFVTAMSMVEYWKAQ